MARCDGIWGVAELEALLHGLVESDAVPGLAVAVVKGEGLVWAGGFGFADLADAIPATPRTAYLWFSMTKIATATAALRLAEGGGIELDAPADEYFPGLKVVSQPAPITVRHLLGHRSGLANPLPIRWVRPADAPPPDRHAFVRRLLARHRRLRFVPGGRAAYSNLGYLVLGEVISTASGMAYEEYVREEILLPLGMADTGFAYGSPTGPGEVATGYQPVWRPLTPFLRAALPRGVVGRRQGRYAAFDRFYVNGPAYGGLVGGAEEAARLAMLHLDGPVGRRLLTAASVEEMRRITPGGGKREYGLGWYRPRAAAGRQPDFVEHLGGGAGFWNVMRIYPEESLGVVVMGNTTSYDHDGICEAVVRVAWGPPRKP